MIRGHYVISSFDNWSPDNSCPTTDPLDNSSPELFIDQTQPNLTMLTGAKFSMP